MHELENNAVLDSIEMTTEPADAAPLPELKTAGFAPRLFAYLIDCLIVLIPMLLIGWALNRGALGAALSQRVFFHYTGLVLVRRLVFAAYFVVVTILTGTTFGKQLLRLRVVDQEGNRARPFDILYRETVGRLLSAFLCIGYIAVAVDRQHRGFHDMLCDTRVVYDI